MTPGNLCCAIGQAGCGKWIIYNHLMNFKTFRSILSNSFDINIRVIHGLQQCDLGLKPRSHCADHSLPMLSISRPPQSFMIVTKPADRGLNSRSLSVQDCWYHLSRELFDTGTTEVFDPLLVRFPRPLVRPLIRSIRLHSRCWRPRPRSCRFATAIKTT